MINNLRQHIALISVHGDPTAETGVEEAGGQCVYVRQIGEYLANIGFYVDMFTRKIWPDAENIVQHSTRCRTVRLTAGPERFIPRDEVFKYLPQFVKSFETFQLREGSCYSLIHTNYWLSGWVGLQLKASSNIKMAHTYLSLGAIRYRNISCVPQIADTRLKVEREILENADCVIASSPQEVEDLRLFVSKFGRIDVVPLGTDTNIFQKLDKSVARCRLGLDSDKRVVLYVGRFDSRKGIDTLVKACAKSKVHYKQSLQLAIVGGCDPERSDFSEYQRIQNLVNTLDLAKDTIFMGRVDHNMLPIYYSGADVCVVPSHYEPFGLVAIEAMSCGVPVIASRVGGLKFTVVDKKTGFLVPSKDVNAFANAMDSLLLGNDNLIKSLGASARYRVCQYFSLPAITKNLSEKYQEILQNSAQK